MTLQEILDIIEKNSDIPQDLEKASRAIPQLHAKFIGFKAQENAIMQALTLEWDTAYKDRWMFYSGKADPLAYKEEKFDLRLLKGDVDKFIDSDPKLTKIKSKMALQKIKIDAIDEFIKGLNNRQWNIKNILDYLKYTQGMI